MAQTEDKKPTESDAPAETQQPSPAASGFDIRGRFARYTSAFGQIILPFLSVRYLFEAFDNIADFNHAFRHWHQPVPVQPREKELLFGKIPNEGIARWLNSNLLTLSFGVAISGVVAYYTDRTYKDIKNLYREAIGYELGKDPKDVTFRDLTQSKNEVVRVTNGALVKRTALRFGSALSFMLPWGLLNPKKYANTDQLNNVGFRVGTGVVGTYLFSDGFLRKQSFFEALQELVDTKVSHSNGNPYDVIAARDVDHLMHLQRGAMDKAYRPAAPNSQEAQENIAFSARIAEMLNQTYNNIAYEGEKPNFTVGKFVYLLGSGLLYDYPQNVAYAELASKNKGVEEVKAATAAIAQGAPAQEVFAQYGITLKAHATADHPLPPSQPEQPAPQSPRFTDKLLQGRKENIPSAPRNPTDFATREEASPALRQ